MNFSANVFHPLAIWIGLRIVPATSSATSLGRSIVESELGEQAVPSNVKTLLTERIESVLQLEVLLLLRRERERDFRGTDLAQELRIDPTWAERQLADLHSRELLSYNTTTGYRYWPRTPELDAAVAELDRAYNDRRVTIISMIFSKPADSLRSFSDAFRIRKDKADG